jgi:putative aminopeptidase FrvX
VGLMLVNDEEGGIFRFDTVGSLDVRQLVGKPVLVGRDHLPGVIGARLILMNPAEERKRAITLDSLRIDVGLEGGKVRPGDRATFATRFSLVGPSLRAKALDDRLGVAILLELLRQPPENVDLLLAFTVQEEIGSRGARVAAHAFKPDLAMAIDCTPANDPRLVRHLAETAESAHIPFQFRQPGRGGTDAGAIHLQVGGIPSVSLSVPGRYLHTAVSLARLDDWRNCLALLGTALQRMDPSILSTTRE